MAEDIKFEGRLWAIVTAGAERVIGMVEGIPPSTDVIPDTLILNPAYEIRTMTQPVQVGLGEIAIRRETLLFPIDSCTHDTRIRLRPDTVLYAGDIHEVDRAMYRDQIRMVRAQQETGRLQKLGLTQPGQDGMPPFDPKKGGGLIGNS